MPVTPPTLATIPHDPKALAAILDEVAADNAGWVNIIPELPEGTEVPATPNALALFSKRGPVIPLATWTRPGEGRNGPTPSELGVVQGTSMKASEALQSSPGAIPESWRIVSDHPRRGTTVMPPVGATTLSQATWILSALVVLCLPPHTGNFVVARYRG